LNLINQKIVQPDHFEVHEEKGGLRLKPEGLRKFFQHWEKNLTGSESVEGEDNMVAGGYRAVFLNRLGALLDSLSNEVPYRTHLEK